LNWRVRSEVENRPHERRRRRVRARRENVADDRRQGFHCAAGENFQFNTSVLIKTEF
jgi:hypothetical protein